MVAGMAVALVLISASTSPALANQHTTPWKLCHRDSARLHLSVRNGLNCQVAYAASTDFLTSAAYYDLGLNGAKSGATSVVRWSDYGEKFSYVDFGNRWSCGWPATTVTCTTSRGQAMRYHGPDVSSTYECAGSQPPYDTNWAGYGPSPLAGPYFTRNLTCSQAKAVEYADAVTRAGGATAAYAFNMFRFARGLHYPLTAAGQAWHCGVSTQDDKVLMTFGDVTYDGFTYNFDCLSTVRTRLGQEVLWAVAEPHCRPTGNYILPPPPLPICKRS